jgi:ferredoxin
MANKSEKWPSNVPGESFTSISSALTAISVVRPRHRFSRATTKGAIPSCSKQPTTEEEVAQCMEALEGCPVEAIGNDGED